MAAEEPFLVSRFHDDLVEEEVQPVILALSQHAEIQKFAWRVVGNGWYIMLFTGSMLYHHFLNPVLAILSLVLFERLPRLPLGQVWWALVPTILYGLYDLHGNITGAIDGPYPFMRVYDQTIQETLMWFTIILVTNLLYAFLLWWLGGNGRKSKVGLEFRT